MKWTTAFVVVVGMSLAAVVARAGDGSSSVEIRVEALERRLEDVEARLPAPDPITTDLDAVKPPDGGAPKGSSEAAGLWFARWQKHWSEADAARSLAKRLEAAIGDAPAGSASRVTNAEELARVRVRYQVHLQAAGYAKREQERALRQ
jgi:hypothetical protein